SFTHASHSSNVTSCVEMAKGRANVTGCCGPSSDWWFGSLSVEPMRNCPGGTEISCGHCSQSTIGPSTVRSPVEGLCKAATSCLVVTGEVGTASFVGTGATGTSGSAVDSSGTDAGATGTDGSLVAAATSSVPLGGAGMGSSIGADFSAAPSSTGCSGETVVGTASPADSAEASTS